MSTPLKVFIVEDDKFYGKMLMHHINMNPDYHVLLFQSGKECLENLHLHPDVITVDYSLPDTTGDVLVEKLKDEIPEIPIIVISGQDDVSTAVNLLHKGAYDYIVKDDNVKNKLWNTLIQVKETKKLREQIITLKEEVAKKYDFGKSIKGKSKALHKVFQLMEKASKTKITTSITGETGTGKELVAKSIHYNSDRKNKPFIPVNVAAIPSELIESELFGHEKGAFTGATERRMGKFEQAQGGSIFLDEIGEMDLNMQAKLLRVLQEKELVRIGGNEIIKLNVRLIVATHRDLSERVKSGTFREDLYYRLLGLPIHLPPLRERGDDIIILSKFFVNDFCKENLMNYLKINEKAQQKLRNYSWPGNVRELKATVELASVMANGIEIVPEDITFNAATSMSDLMTTESSLKDYNKKIIKYFLEKYDNNVLKVAEKLDIGKSTIYRMLKEEEL